MPCVRRGDRPGAVDDDALDCHLRLDTRARTQRRRDTPRSAASICLLLVFGEIETLGGRSNPDP